MEITFEDDASALILFTEIERAAFLRKASFRLVDAVMGHVQLDETGREAQLLGEALYALPFFSIHSQLKIETSGVPFVINCLAYENEANERLPLNDRLEAAAQGAAQYLLVELAVHETDLYIPTVLPENFGLDS